MLAFTTLANPTPAAPRTAQALAVQPPSAVLHVGIAGARGVAPPQLVIGSEAVYEDAAVRWERWGHALERAHALFGAGRCLAGLGRLQEARARFEAAAAAFARLGAEPALAEVRSAMGPDPLNPGPA